MSDSERLQYVLSSLKLSKNKLGVLIGDKNGMRIHYVLTERNGISESLASDISEVFPDVHYDWLLYGTGELPTITAVDSKRKDSTENLGKGNAVEISPIDGSGPELLKKIDETEFYYIDDEHIMVSCPFIPIPAYAGYMQGFGDHVMDYEWPKKEFIVSQVTFGVHRAFEVRGDSMFNGQFGSYREKDVVFCRKLQRKYFKDPLQIRRQPDWIIVHKTEGILLKQIVDHDILNGTIKCHSLNPDYEDFEMHLDEVLELFYVVEHSSPKR